MTETEAKYECPARKAWEVVEGLRKKGPAFCSWSDIEYLDSTLSAPCPCEAERDQLRAELAEALEALGDLWENTYDHQQASALDRAIAVFTKHRKVKP